MPNVEDQLRKAIEEGKFDNLPGKGKKIHLGETNPHADRDWELAYGMIKDAGYSLPWIETLHEIEKDIEAARKELRLAWQFYQYGRQQTHNSEPNNDEWGRAQQAFRDKLTVLNKRIRDYNLEAPVARFQRPALSYEAEVKKIISQE